MRSSALRLLIVCLAIAVTFGATAQSSDPFALTPPLVSQAITSCGDVAMSNGLIDSSATTGRGNVLSNGTIKVSGGLINGDAIAGPGSAVKISGNGAVGGTIASATTSFPCSIIDLGALATTLASTNDNASIPLTAQHKVALQTNGDFKLSGGDSLTLQAGTYYFHKFTMSGGSTLTLAGPVRILTTSDVSVSGGSVAGTSPWQLHFWSSATKFDLGSSTFAGFIYAPSAPVAISGEIVSGSVYGGTVTITGNSHITRLIDATPPVVTIISPVDHETVIDLSHVAVRGTVTDPETAITSFQVNGADVALASDGSFTTTVNLSTATPPSITATATNAAGLSVTSTVTVQSSITQLTVTPPSLTIDQNATGHLAAIGTYADGSTADLTTSATWSSAAPSIATVSAGTVTGVTPATTTITATLGSFSGSATVTVNPLLQSIKVTPATATVALGGKQPFTATGTYSDGTTKDLTSSVAWSTSDTGLATIDATGLATALSPGTVTVRATLGSITGSAMVTILATPTITALQPIKGRTSGGDTVTITGTNFGTATNTSVSFGGNTAVVTAATATTLTVTTPSHAAGTVDVTVTAPTGTVTKNGGFNYLAAPTVTSIAPNKGRMSGGDTVTITGTNFDVGGTTLTIGGAAATNVVVTSSTSLTATTPAGNAGAVSVTATTAGGFATLTSGFTYVPAPVISSFTPSQGQPGTSVTINGSNFDAVPTNDLVVIGGAPAVVTSATTTRLIATVAANAVTGPISVTTVGGTATTATNFVVSIYKSLQFTSSATAIQNGGHLQWAASVTKFDNTTFDVTSSGVWTSSDSTVATVSSAGLVTAVASGATDITVAFSGLTATVHLAITTPVSLPPPTIQGPRLDPTIVTPIADSIRFLYSGPNAIQTGVAPNAIADNRAAVLSGRVLDASGAPLAGVQVTTAQHPEFGQTVTRADGHYDFVWNGGGPLDLTFTKANYIASDRMVTTKWNQQKPVDDVVLVAYDGAVTTITTGAAAMQVAQGSSVTDSSGTRRATILFPAGTTATLTNADGTTTPASTLHVRATEFTVGALGPKAMPALLPSNSAYTYCVDLSVDEAPGVTFSNPLPVYIDNFINFPVGTPVPLGYFDRTQLKWLPLANGVVMKILTVANGTVTIDTDGDGVADNAPGLTSDELAQLATLYTAGQTLWRVRVQHFTSYDGNWPYASPPADAIAPNLPQPEASPTVCQACQVPSSIVDVENQRLGESIPITGTPYSLDYNSGRTDRVQYQMTVPVSGASVPASLQSITVQISIAGRTFTQQMPPAPNQTLTFTWDGIDGYGRKVEGARSADVMVSYTYPAHYAPPQTAIPAFDMPPARTTIIGGGGRPTISFNQIASVSLGRISSVGEGLGGWSFSAQRAYDTIARMLYDGTVQRGSDAARNGEASIYRAAGNGGFTNKLASGVATQVGLSFPTSLSPTADGGFYFVDNGHGAIYYVNSGGFLSLVAGAPDQSAFTTPDGAPAVGSYINPFMMAVAPDGTVYFNEILSGGKGDLLRKIVNGVLQTVGGGTASSAPLGDGGPVAAANLGSICGLAFAPDGVLYISDCGHGLVRRLSLNGIITSIAGGGSSSADNIPALQANISPSGIAVGPDGSVYVMDDLLAVVRISPDGFIHYLGDPHGPPMVDGQPAAGHSTVDFAWGVAVAGDGTVLFSERSGGHDRVWTISGGIAHVLAGTPSGNFGLTLNGSLARAGQLSYMYDVKVMPDGSALIADSDQNVIEKTGPTFPPLATGNTATIIPSEDGTIGYIFENGRHTRTVSTITGTTLETLGYDPNGYLTSITDVDGQATTIQRDASENATAIIASSGQQTALSIGTKGLASITDPAGQAYLFDYNNLGLLSQLTDPRGGLHTFTYDDAGRLIKDQNPEGGFLMLTRSGSTSNFAVLRQTAEGRTTSSAWQQSSDILISRPTTGADGLVMSQSESGDGSTTSTSPSGSIFTSVVSVDSRFGMSAPVTTNQTIAMPSGLKATITGSRQVTLSNPADPLSVTAYTETESINGTSFRSTYTNSTRTLALTSPVGRTQTGTFDTSDRPVSVQVPGLNAVSLGYESHGLVSTMTSGTRQASFTYDDHQRLKTITDTLQRTTSFDYDAADRVTRQTLPDGRQIAFTYDADGNVTSVTPPSRPAHMFAFTAVDLMQTYTAPTVANVTSTLTTYTWNHDQQLTRVDRPDGASIALGYDSAGRLSTLTEPLGVHQYSYDGAKGTVAAVNSPDGTLGFSWDGDLLKTIASTGAVSSTVAFNYDNNFRITSENVNGANSIAFGYDNDDLLTSAGALTLRRDPGNGLLTGTTLSNLTDTYGYNAFGEVTSYTVQLSGSPLITFGYTRDDAGRIATRTETVNSQTTTTSYGYDSAGRLTDVTTGTGTTHYGYDDNGNRTSVANASGTVSATYDAQDRMTTYNGASYFYSDNGDLQKKIDASGTTLYGYDTLGNLRHVTLPDGTNIDYLIDASNRRIGKKVNGTLTVGWIYGDQLRIVAETDGGGAITKRFVYGSRSNIPDYMTWQGGTYKIVSTPAGTPRYVLQASAGTLAQALTFDDFGNVLADSNRAFTPFGFAGGLYDPDTGLTRFGSRDYEPTTGRFCSKDPIGFAGHDGNLYEYAFADPVTLTDSSGMDVWLEGPSGDEPTGHLSINVGDPRGDYASFSFGVDGLGIDGQVYRDTTLGGTILDEWYRKTTPAEDARVFNMLQSLVGHKANYLPWRTCRNFSIENFQRIAKMGIGRPAAPKSRIPYGNTKSWIVPSSLKPTPTDRENGMSGTGPTTNSTRP
jgi:RHS repeat-associated protein